MSILIQNLQYVHYWVSLSSELDLTTQNNLSSACVLGGHIILHIPTTSSLLNPFMLLYPYLLFFHARSVASGETGLG